ncbi:hypothetical protein [Nostoc sp. LPT]|uniref:hypothetical protein n=1 Tax=Nostoc sp. LPT TaxID=2815387 RepID=UPI001DAD23FB|nr:hypothetical protein [Nostoc sp. LPT]MBN4001153.1 hypothetical protein [Nostoc sp. LPT]
MADTSALKYKVICINIRPLAKVPNTPPQGIGKARWFHTSRELKLGFKAFPPVGERNGSEGKSHATKREIKTYVFFFFPMKPPCPKALRRGAFALLKYGVELFFFDLCKRFIAIFLINIATFFINIEMFFIKISMFFINITIFLINIAIFLINIEIFLINIAIFLINIKAIAKKNR